MIKMMIEVPVEDLELVMKMAEECYEVTRADWDVSDPDVEARQKRFDDTLKDREALVRIGAILAFKEKLQR